MKKNLLTPLRFDILQLCATGHNPDLPGIGPYHWKHFKPVSTRTLHWLVKQGYVKLNMFNTYVTTDEGQRVYEHQLNIEDGQYD